MTESKKHKQRIGLVLSAVPGYSETFFRNKIVGLQEHGFEVVLFVDYNHGHDTDFSCKVVASHPFNSGILKTVWYSFLALLKSLFIHPKRSYTLFQLNKNDGITFKDNIRALILNQFILKETVDWLHFGFGMFVFNRENVAEAMGAKMAVSFRGADLYLSPLKHKNCYDLLFSKAVNYHVLSQEMKQTLIAYQIAPNKIQVITPAIDTQFFKHETEKKETTSLQLITVARLHWKKGLVYTLEALAELKRAGIPFHYTLIGTGEERERLVFAAHQLNILDTVTFAGRLEPTAVKEQLAASDIYLQYSIQEGFCNAVIEAQAMGLLCVVSNADGLQENVLDGQTGWVVSKRQPKLLAEQLLEIMKLSETEKEVIRIRAISRVQKEFDLIKQQQAFIAFYTL